MGLHFLLVQAASGSKVDIMTFFNSEKTQVISFF